MPIEPLRRDVIDSLFALYEAGDFAALRRRAEKLVVAHPDESVLHSLLGAARFELGQYEEAIESYRAALRIRPEFAKAHNAIGVAYLRLGQPEPARTSFRAAVASEPGFAAAHFNLGIVHEQRADWRRAAEHYRDAARCDPGHAGAFTGLGTALWQLGEHGGVVESFERALALAPRYRPAQRGLLGFLEQANRHGELRVALQRARSALGADPLVTLYEGILVDIDGDVAGAKAILESVEFRGGGESDDRDERQRCARLVRLCDRLDEPDAAVSYAHAANGLSRRIAERKGIDRRRFSAFVEHRRRYFAAEQNLRCRSEPGASGAQRGPVFLIGFPRSGTTLLDVMLRGHPAIDVAEETDAVARMVTELAGSDDERLGRIGSLSSSERERIGRLYFDVLRQRVGQRAPAARLIDRFALNIVYAGEIQRVFPDARFILMLRHPADCVLSCFLQTFYETSANAHFYTLEDAAALYARVFELWTLCRQRLGLDVIELRYEDLVADPEASCRALLAQLQIPWHDAVLDHERTARERPFIKTVSYDQVTRPVYSSAVERWRRYAAALEPVLPALAPWIERLGYRV